RARDGAAHQPDPQARRPARAPGGQGLRRRQRAAGLHALQRGRAERRVHRRVPEPRAHPHRRARPARRLAAQDLLLPAQRPRHGEAPAQGEQRHHRAARARLRRAALPRHHRRRRGAVQMSATPKIRVLIVDDSRMIRDVLTDILGEQPDIEVVGAAADAYEARDMVRDLKPDVITLDVEMPKMSGLEFLDKLMRARPIPVLMISSFTERGSEVTFRALELGAVDFVTKPKLNEQTPDDYGAMIAEKIRAARSARLKAPRRADPNDTVTMPAVVEKRPVPRGVKTSEQLIA